MTFLEAKSIADTLWKAVEQTSKALQVFPRGVTGLIPDSVKNSPEYRAALNAYNVANARMRAFNKVYTKAFKRERDRMSAAISLLIAAGKRSH